MNCFASNAHFVVAVCTFFRQVLHGTAGAMSPQVQSRNQQLPGSTPVSTFPEQ